MSRSKPASNFTSGKRGSSEPLEGTDSQVSKSGLGVPNAVLVQIEKPIYGGNFLAREEGKAVFVPFALPGERVRARIVEDKRSYANAELVEIVSAAPDRIAPHCPHFGPCGGCHYQHTNYEMQLAFKQAILRETLARGGVAAPKNIDVLAGEPWEYRNRVRLAFDAHGNPAYRGRRSHAFVSIRECPITSPLLVNAAFAVASSVKAVEPELRPAEMALFCNGEETSLLVSLFVARPAKIRSELWLDLKKRVPQLAGAELIVERTGQQPARSMATWGETSLAYSAAGFDYRVDHGAFFQVNRWLVDALVDRVTSDMRGAVAWDLFAGVGLFAHKLADTFDRVVAVESAPTATDSLGANLRGLQHPPQAEPGPGIRLQCVASPVFEFLRKPRGERPDLIVMDPPRTGLGAEISALIAQIGAPSLVYVSCDPATLARDLRVLIAAGYVIDSMTLADLFPQTFHLETVVRMRLP